MKIYVTNSKAARRGRSAILAAGLSCLLLGGAFLAEAQAVYSAPYTFTTLADKAQPDKPAANGNGRISRFSNPKGLAVDANGNVYVADTRNHTICQISSAGDVTILAGQAGSGGAVDGTDHAARFCYPQAVALDRAGNLYVADSGNKTIRKITPAGIVTTLAGRAGAVGSADGRGSAARFSFPNSVAVDRNGNVYVADLYSATIRKITPDGLVTTLAGEAGCDGNTDGQGANARFNYPAGIAVDGNGNVYVADIFNNSIRKITPDGLVSTLVGALTYSTGGADGAGEAAQFNHPCALAVDDAGNVYVADNGNNTIRRVTPAGVVSTVAGLAGQCGNANGTGNDARFWHPAGIAVDAAGNLYVADVDNIAIRKGSPAGPAAMTALRTTNSTFTFRTP